METQGEATARAESREDGLYVARGTYVGKTHIGGSGYGGLERYYKIKAHPLWGQGQYLYNAEKAVDEREEGFVESR